MLNIIHGADFHLDSPFSGLSPERAAQRRGEQRDLLTRLAQLAREKQADLVLLSGDLMDGETVYRETAQALSQALGGIPCPVFLAPGNHDCYSPSSVYATLDWPDNVHIFSTVAVEGVELPGLNCVVHGAAFTTPQADRSPLMGFAAPRDGRIHLMALHGDVEGKGRYGPIALEDIAASGLDYLALGHVHSCTGVVRAGRVAYGYCGCPEGRGFDELGDKGFLYGDIGPGTAELRFVAFARRRYRIWEADVTDGDPLAAVERLLPQDTAEDICRLRLVGTPEEPVRLPLLQQSLEGRFFALQLRDETTVRREIWDKCGEDTLRGLFLQELRRTKCGQFGLESKILLEKDSTQV